MSRLLAVILPKIAVIMIITGKTISNSKSTSPDIDIDDSDNNNNSNTNKK